MKMYRLKLEAVPFFKDSMAAAIHTLDIWKEHNVDPKALEEVQPLYITYGIEKKREGYTMTEKCEWSHDDGSRFHFTLNFPSVKYNEYNKFSKGRMVRELMDNIQRQLDSFYQNFINDLNEQNQ